MTERRKLSLRKKLLFALVVFVPCALLLEAGVRLGGLGPAITEVPETDAAPPIHQPDAFEYFSVADRRLGYRNRPNGVYRSPHIAGHPVSTTDACGYRNGYGWSGLDDTPIIVFVGDSTTFCSEVPDDQTGPSEVAKRLAGRFDVRVLNAGVRGYSTLQSKRMLQECLEQFPEICAAVYTYCGNDLEENLIGDLRDPVRVPVVDYDPRTRTFREVEVSEPIIPFGQEFLTWQRPPQPEPGRLVRFSRWLEGRSAVWHHSVIGWQRLTDPQRTNVQINNWARAHGGFETVDYLLTEIDRICRDHGAVFVATCFYDKSDPVTPAVFGEGCQDSGIRHVSLMRSFPGPRANYLARRADGQLDAHYGPQGTRCYAEALAPELAKILSRRSP